MQKRILCLVLALALLCALGACGKEETDPQAAPTVSPQEVQPAPTALKGDKTVKITLPLAYVEETYRGALDAYRINRGFLDLKVNEKKQTVTIKMTERGHKLLLIDIGLQVLEAIYALPDDPAYPYLKSIDALDDENYKTVAVSVDRAAYEADENAELLPFVLASHCMTYQAYTKKNQYRCTVLVNDAADGSEVFRNTYTDKN